MKLSFELPTGDNQDYLVNLDMQAKFTAGSIHTLSIDMAFDSIKLSQVSQDKKFFFQVDSYLEKVTIARSVLKQITIQKITDILTEQNHNIEEMFRNIHDGKLQLGINFFVRKDRSRIEPLQCITAHNPNAQYFSSSFNFHSVHFDWDKIKNFDDMWDEIVNLLLQNIQFYIECNADYGMAIASLRSLPDIYLYQFREMDVSQSQTLQGESIDR